jgi:hypothetical protein
MRVDDTLQHAAGISAGNTATLDIEARIMPSESEPERAIGQLA